MHDPDLSINLFFGDTAHKLRIITCYLANMIITCYLANMIITCYHLANYKYDNHLLQAMSMTLSELSWLNSEGSAVMRFSLIDITER